MTGPAVQSKRSGLLLGTVAVVAVVAFVAFAGQDDPVLGGPGDPEGTGPEGLAGLRLLIEETGGLAELDVSVPAPRHDVAILSTNAYVDVFAEFEDRPDGTDANLAPVLEWVRDGGVLVTGVSVPGGPADGITFVHDDETVLRGVCDVEDIAGVRELRPLEHSPIEVGEADRSCFGDGDRAVVVVRSVGAGQVVRLAGIRMFSNRALDDLDNAALAARLLRLQEGRSIAFLSGPANRLGGAGGPVNDEGNPVGAGDSGLLELIPQRVLATFVGLSVALFLYALSKGRRLGSPVVETTPIKLPSSSFVEAVGRMYARVENPQSRSSEILRSDFRTSAARRIGMPPTSSGVEIAAMLVSEPKEQAELGTMLDGPTPTTDDDLVSLATHLNLTRQRMERGGASDLVARPNDGSTEGTPE